MLINITAPKGRMDFRARQHRRAHAGSLLSTVVLFAALPITHCSHGHHCADRVFRVSQLKLLPHDLVLTLFPQCLWN